MPGTGQMPPKIKSHVCPEPGRPPPKNGILIFSKMGSKKGFQRKEPQVRAMKSEAEKYWQYAKECSKQALEADTPQLRDQLLGLVRIWTEAAVCEETRAMPCEKAAGENKTRGKRHGSHSKVHSL